ncbi:MarR family winged helix-turn-helix transcriptional regulator [Pusillimonas noertemannii]|uniref:DNA-binding MarR family transcriptional regulator n=1 Tax=Pusillimonas noertemannii TaxID=305977 RepID=A0A2U1CNV4_9BURK|nr:MarR family transcriptional regulator [Pusillimonas noertemannii]NYT68290.1 MarR family transcriptional regulator [Pusillimonas noertemannii]PVY62695.1 DNA-binding MarR family transcriptional regulator [Pusillimonas noertemannii]TFL10366.1 MarR family transcriptional regulator [Pusillimonas noertemannii]
MKVEGEFKLDDYALEKAVPYLLNRAGVRIGEAFSEELVKFNLTLPMYRVLASLLRIDAQRMTHLAEYTSIDISTLSRLVAGMEKKGLVKREPGRKDKRSVHVMLQEPGRDLVMRLAPLADLYERVALANITAEEVATLKRLLIRIYDNIESLGSR